MTIFFYETNFKVNLFFFKYNIKLLNNPGIILLCSPVQSLYDGRHSVSALSQRIIGFKWKEPGRLQNMEQNADSWIINIYIYFKQRENWILRRAFYAFCLLIVTLLQPMRQTMNTFEVNLLMETWKEACEGQLLSSAESNWAPLTCLCH